MNKVDDDRRFELAAAGVHADRLELVVGAVNRLRADRSPGGVEPLVVGAGQLRELLDLAFTQPLPGLALDRPHGVVECEVACPQ
jgi:hypothetical protein